MRNEFKRVKMNGQWVEEPEVVRREAKKFFEERFNTTKDFGVRLGDVEFKSISVEENVSLTSNITEDEVMWQRDGSKILGSDGFNLNFVKNSWEVIKEDIMSVINYF